MAERGCRRVSEKRDERRDDSEGHESQAMRESF